MTPTRIVLAVGAVAGAFGLSLGAASIASAQTTPSTTPAPATTAPGSTAPSPGPMNGNCPNMGGSSGSSTPSPSGV